VEYQSKVTDTQMIMIRKKNHAPKKKTKQNKNKTKKKTAHTHTHTHIEKKTDYQNKTTKTKLFRKRTSKSCTKPTLSGKKYHYLLFLCFHKYLSK
jgi:hypothetical protein